LGRSLGKDLYRIDLNAVISEYIGETEKNLGRVFDAAKGNRAVLFFDEADAFFGKRSEVKDSHDRYANIEINYLLRRSERYAGLTILAVSNRTRIDKTWLRRFHFIIPVPRRRNREKRSTC
jgi:SpoVK/Ycf46/Vps4 family AAA+-type ATPase